LDFSIILINFDSADYIEPCLERIRRQTFRGSREIIVVNHRATDGSLDILRRQSDIRLIDPGKNLGFSGGNNLAISQSTGKYVLCLNFDCWLTERFLDDVCQEFKKYSRVGMISGKLRKLVGMHETGILDCTGIDFTCLTPADRGEWELDRGQFDADVDIFGPSGAAACYRRTALDQVAYKGTQYFDEEMFTYCEDIDLAWRLNLAGWRGRFLPSALAYHERGSTRRESRWRQIGYYAIGFRNRYYTVAKNLRRRDARGYLGKFIRQELWFARVWCRFSPLKWSIVGSVVLMLALMILRPSFFRKRRFIRQTSRPEPLDFKLGHDLLALSHKRHSQRVDRTPDPKPDPKAKPGQPARPAQPPRPPLSIRIKHWLARRVPRPYFFVRDSYRTVFPRRVFDGAAEPSPATDATASGAPAIALAGAGIGAPAVSTVEPTALPGNGAAAPADAPSLKPTALPGDSAAACAAGSDAATADGWGAPPAGSDAAPLTRFGRFKHAVRGQLPWTFAIIKKCYRSIIPFIAPLEGHPPLTETVMFKREVQHRLPRTFGAMKKCFRAMIPFHPPEPAAPAAQDGKPPALPWDQSVACVVSQTAAASPPAAEAAAAPAPPEPIPAPAAEVAPPAPVPPPAGLTDHAAAPSPGSAGASPTAAPAQADASPAPSPEIPMPVQAILAAMPAAEELAPPTPQAAPAPLSQLVAGKPELVHAELSTICNMQCRMCGKTVDPSTHTRRGLMNQKVFERLCDALGPGVMLGMYGNGEPLLNPRFPEFLRMAKGRLATVTFNTNAKALSPAVAEAMVACGQDMLCISCSAGTAATYNVIHAGGTWDQLWRNIAYLQDEKRRRHYGVLGVPPHIGFEFVSQRANVEELPLLVGKAMEEGLRSIVVVDLVALSGPMERERMNTPENLPLAERCYAEAVSRMEALRPVNPEFRLWFNMPFDSATKRFKPEVYEDAAAAEYTPDDDSHDALAGGNGDLSASADEPAVDPSAIICREPWRTFYVHFDGAVSPCCVSQRTLGSLANHTAMEIWNGEEFRKFRARMMSPDKPFECQRCHMLPGPKRFDTALSTAEHYEPL